MINLELKCSFPKARTEKEKKGYLQGFYKDIGERVSKEVGIHESIFEDKDLGELINMEIRFIVMKEDKWKVYYEKMKEIIGKEKYCEIVNDLEHNRQG